MVLSNPELEQQLEESQWELEEMKAQLRAQKIEEKLKLLLIKLLYF